MDFPKCKICGKRHRLGPCAANDRPTEVEALAGKVLAPKPSRLAVHHKIWLEAHPKRSAEWLADRIRDGFVIHHADGNHGNNVADNLLLIEQLDHILLHRIQRDAAPPAFDRKAYMREFMRKKRAAERAATEC